MDMKPAEIQAVIDFGKIGLRALSTRALSWAALLGAYAAFGAALAFPTYERAALAAAFAILVLWPILRHDKKE